MVSWSLPHCLPSSHTMCHFNFRRMTVCLHAGMHMHSECSTPRGQRRVPDCPERELQWLGTESTELTGTATFLS